MTPFVIQAVWSRRRTVAAMLETVPDAVVYYDMARQPTRACGGSIMAAGGKAHVHMEDDVIMCTGFRDKVEAAIAEQPDEIINFFPGSVRTEVLESKWFPASNFGAHLCVYFPAWFPVAYIDWALANNWHPDPFCRWNAQDYSVREFLKTVKRRYLVWHPILVQHMIGLSSIDRARDHKPFRGEVTPRAGARRAMVRQYKFYADGHPSLEAYRCAQEAAATNATA